MKQYPTVYENNVDNVTGSMDYLKMLKNFRNYELAEV